MKSTRLLTAAWIIVALSSTAHAAETLRQVSWAELEKKAGMTLPGKILPAEWSGGGEVLKIENPENQPKQVMLLELEKPGITEAAYAIRGRVRYENVQGTKFLEMWSYFPDGRHYFSRTLGETGLMQHLEGDSGWCDFSLPFSISKSENRPDRLVVNVVFQGSGTVYLGPLRLEQYTNLDKLNTPPGAWWGNGTGGWIGGALGTVIGCLGGLIGLLAGRGRARALVTVLTAAMLVGGLAILTVGVSAAMLGQPYAVWYPLAIGGFIPTVVVAATYRAIRRRYEQAELQRMSAMDLGKSGV